MIRWPMDILTRSTGENRKLIVAPSKAIDRKYLDLCDGEYSIAFWKMKDSDHYTGKIKLPFGTYYAEVKEQGHFHILARDADGDYSLCGKRLNVAGAYTDIWPKVGSHLAVSDIPRETAVAIELIWPGHQDSQVPTAIKDCPSELRMRALGVAIYRGVLIAGRRYSYNLGRRMLVNMFGQGNCVECLPNAIHITSAKESEEALCDLLYNARVNGIEGWVLKRYAYDEWYKVKGISECDVFVIGFKISESETYAGLITAVEVGLYSPTKRIVPMGRVSGFSDEEKITMSSAYREHGTSPDNPFMYAAMRITYQERATRGKFKHGFFDGWREDKSDIDCTMEQLK